MLKLPPVYVCRIYPLSKQGIPNTSREQFTAVQKHLTLPQLHDILDEILLYSHEFTDRFFLEGEQGNGQPGQLPAGQSALLIVLKAQIL